MSETTCCKGLAPIDECKCARQSPPTPLRRALPRWAAMSPKAISEGSAAQFMYAMDDAQHDIAALAAEIERLRTENADLRLRLAGQRQGVPCPRLKPSAQPPAQGDRDG